MPLRWSSRSTRTAGAAVRAGGAAAGVPTTLYCVFAARHDTPTEPRYVDCYGFPKNGAGSGIAFLLQLAGSDYTTSLVGAALSPVKALEGGIANIQTCFSLVLGSHGEHRGQIHTGGLIDLVCRAHTLKNPRPVFSFDTRAGEFQFRRCGSCIANCARTQAAEAAANGGRSYSQLAESCCLLASWGFCGTDNVLACPPHSPVGAVVPRNRTAAVFEARHGFSRQKFFCFPF